MPVALRHPISVCSLVLLGLAAPLAGCTGGLVAWRRTALPPPESLRPRQQVQVWRGDSALVLHAVRLTSDSVSGVPYHRPPGCDRYRLSLPRAEVDSLRAGNLETAGAVLGALPFVALGVGVMAMRIGMSGD